MTSKFIGVIRDGIKRFRLIVRQHSPYPELVGLLCAIGTICCSYMLIKWNTIPVYDYYIDAEYYCPDTVKKNLRTLVALFIEPDELLNTYANQSEGKESFVISIEDSTRSILSSAKEKKTFVSNRNEQENNVVSKKLQYYTAGEFDDTISTFLKWEETPDRLFFVHIYSCYEQKNVFIKADTNVLYIYKDTIEYSNYKGNYCLSILNRRIDSIFHSYEYSRSFLSAAHIYSHCSVLKITNNSNPFTSRIEGEMKRMTYRKNRLQTLLMPKDISRAYYRVSFSSWTIPTYNLRVNFKQDVVFESLPGNYQVGVNSVEIPNQKVCISHGYNSVKLYVEFPDGENAQTIRTFFMALVITWLLKEFIRSLFRTFQKYTNKL